MTCSWLFGTSRRLRDSSALEDCSTRAVMHRVVGGVDTGIRCLAPSRKFLRLPQMYHRQIELRLGEPSPVILAQGLDGVRTWLVGTLLLRRVAPPAAARHGMTTPSRAMSSTSALLQRASRRSAANAIGRMWTPARMC